MSDHQGVDVAAALAASKGEPGEADTAWRLFCAAQTAGLSLDARTLAALLSCCGRGSGWDAKGRGRAVFEAAQRAGLDSDPFVVSAHVTALSRAGDVDGAFAAADGAASADVVTLNALLSAALRAGEFARGVEAHSRAVALGVVPDGTTTTALVQLLTACGDTSAAVAVYEACGLRPSPRLLSAALSACGRGGDTDRAWQLYSGALARGVQPDGAVLTALVHACGADSDAAWRAFQEGRRHGLALGACEPAVCAMLCVFAKSREANRAVLFFETVRREWPGRRPARVAYLLLRDVAAAAGDEALAQRVAAMMSAELPRGSGKASTEDGGKAAARRSPGAAVATFTADGVSYETRNGEEEELGGNARARQLLAGAGPALCEALGTAYAPDVSCVQLMAGGAAAQRAALCSHAEKKALGALLLRRTTTEPARVRVTIRMCRDCHALFSLASAHFKRPIECLDGHTHIFQDGACSCGNRWR